MADPAFQQSGEADETGGGLQQETEPAAGGELAAQSTAELIALRDRLLEECLELETRTDGFEFAEEATDPEPVRARIDEIHQELALRDLAERVGVAGKPMQARAAPAPAEIPPAGPALAARAAQNAFRILDVIEMRSRFMDELAQAAREQGRLDQAATFALNAQKLDMERVEVLRKLSALGADAPDAKD